MSRQVEMPAVCTGPCGKPMVHVTIEPVARGRIFLACTFCGTVQNVPKPPRDERS